ncbi:MAG: hypothetical protein UV04_C0044G0007 [Candidatus Gottesmanbacteria bacterium GW2011_GWA2_42_16]|nr:MAG: hypothetical protein UV04_C0044G0007 [Candidatus Gottesmanbacteria bacterium GW2011_GWA2_42_16]
MTPERIGALITELQNGVPPNKEEIGLIFGSISRPRRAQLLFMGKLFLLCRRGRISSSEEETLLNLSEASDPDPLLSRLGSLCGLYVTQSLSQFLFNRPSTGRFYFGRVFFYYLC